MEIAEKICDRVAIINEGVLVQVGRTSDVVSELHAGSLEEAFLKAIHAEEEVKEVADSL